MADRFTLIVNISTGLRVHLCDGIFDGPRPSTSVTRQHLLCCFVMSILATILPPSGYHMLCLQDWKIADDEKADIDLQMVRYNGRAVVSVSC